MSLKIGVDRDDYEAVIGAWILWDCDQWGARPMEPAPGTG